MTDNLLEVRDLTVEYRRNRRTFRALHEVSLDVRPGETVGVVGESGSGKTTIGRAILGLAAVSSGAIYFDGADIAHLSHSGRRELSKDIQVVFQDPYSSLNPSLTIEQILCEPLLAQGIGRVEARARVRGLLDQVRLPTDAADRLPREFSGGQRQRIAIARALSIRPRLIVCDEPVSALDLSTQSRVLDLMIEIQRDVGCAYLFISHDLAVVRHVSHRVVVLYGGRVVESGDVETITSNPRDPYTQRLMMSSPLPHPIAQRARREELQRAFPSSPGKGPLPGESEPGR